jgi:iron complex transport system substrate-binding protein
MRRFSFIVRLAALFCLGCLVMLPVARAEISLRDDAGRALTLASPARRIVSLAPNVTELLYAAGAGNLVVGVVEYSDYPEAAKRIARVGSGAGIDIEAIVALHPDLVIAWQTGNPSWQVERLVRLGVPVFVTEPRRLDDIPRLLEKLGQLAGMNAAADRSASDFRRRSAQLRARYATRPTLTVFYQILDSSLLTVNRDHLISDVIQLCGGSNVFGDFPGLTPQLDMESVMKKNPEVILASGYEPLWPEWRERWKKWPMLSAVKSDDLFLLPADLMDRQSPRILEGAEKMCVALERARKKRKTSGRSGVHLK